MPVDMVDEVGVEVFRIEKQVTQELARETESRAKGILGLVTRHGVPMVSSLVQWIAGKAGSIADAVSAMKANRMWAGIPAQGEGAPAFYLVSGMPGGVDLGAARDSVLVELQKKGVAVRPDSVTVVEDVEGCDAIKVGLAPEQVWDANAAYMDLMSRDAPELEGVHLLANEGYNDSLGRAASGIEGGLIDADKGDLVFSFDNPSEAWAVYEEMSDLGIDCDFMQDLSVDPNVTTLHASSTSVIAAFGKASTKQAEAAGVRTAGLNLGRVMPASVVIDGLGRPSAEKTEKTKDLSGMNRRREKVTPLQNQERASKTAEHMAGKDIKVPERAHVKSNR